MKSASNLQVLSWPNWRGTGFIVTTYTRVQGASRLKASTLGRSCKVWLNMKARELSRSIEFLTKTQMTTILTIIARNHGFALIEEASLPLFVADYIAVPYHVGLVNDRLHRLNQVIKARVPFLKGRLISPSIINMFACEEWTGVIPCHVYEMNCLLNKILNKRNMCTFFLLWECWSVAGWYTT